MNDRTAFSTCRWSVLRSRLFIVPHLASIIGTTADMIDNTRKSPCDVRAALAAAGESGGLFLRISYLGSRRDLSAAWPLQRPCLRLAHHSDNVCRCSRRHHSGGVPLPNSSARMMINRISPSPPLG